MAAWAQKHTGETAIVARNGDVTYTYVDTLGGYSALGGVFSMNNHGVVAFVGYLDSGGKGIFTGPDPVADKVIAVGDYLCTG